MKNSNHLSLLTLLVTLLAGAPQAAAVEKNNLHELALHNQNERNGDFDRFALDLLGSIERLKADSKVELLAQRLGHIPGSMRNPLDLIDGLEKLLSAKLPGDTHLRLSNLLADLYRRAGT